jgi:hypothetical protein
MLTKQNKNPFVIAFLFGKTTFFSDGMHTKKKTNQYNIKQEKKTFDLCLLENKNIFFYEIYVYLYDQCLHSFCNNTFYSMQK